MQNTNNVLMIRPADFTYNVETAANNLFQVTGNTENAQQKALEEFNAFVEKLKANGINVFVIDDTPEPHTPDSIFPNNWISFHDNGIIVLYPMFANNRRAERKQHVIDLINQNFKPTRIIDLTYFENDSLFLEGTGSMVLDRKNKIAYACLSPRTNKKVLDIFCTKMNYTSCCFNATDENAQAIYHTNVMMCVADNYVIICLDAIQNNYEKKSVTNVIENSGKRIIEITRKQINCFAGNMLQLENNNNEKILIMSSQAFESLNGKQLAILEKLNKIITAELKTIETNGGGSARCMIAEFF